MVMARQSFQIPTLDRQLGGGLIPGTLDRGGRRHRARARRNWGCAGRNRAGRRGRRGVICDLTSRGDSQNHAGYARQHFGWELQPYPVDGPDLDLERGLGLRPRRSAITTTRSPAPAAASPAATSSPTTGTTGSRSWHGTSAVGRFFYEHFIRGARRVVVDGIEPAERFGESIQFEFFEYLYHQILRKEDEWAARELFREQYRAQADRVLSHRYDHQTIGCLYLYTTPHVFLDDLIAQPIGEGDIFSNANTIILMGRTRQEGRVGRALYVAKHRGSACGDEILPYRITEEGSISTP